MPASDLVWDPSSGPVFQVYGTKRKSSFQETEPQMSDVSMELNSMCKRRCMQRTEPEGLEVNHNDPDLHSLQHCQSMSTPHNQAMDQDMETQSHSHHHLISVQSYYGGPQIQHMQSQPSQATNDQYPAHMTAENNMVMDLCDETYMMLPEKTRSEREQEAAQSLMDSDCTPNQQQYHHNSLTFCDPNCVGARTTGPKVRCYCKPSWDGGMDLRPYVSDYY
ncbi:uncharacterized protein LOC135466854 [Liolophura sinensis]|uniref:uncharacterized protein LOC135466854 n=1 Tax=Liolophura sinensis TaxID=3198878 RepID=UPI003158807F